MGLSHLKSAICTVLDIDSLESRPRPRQRSRPTDENAKTHESNYQETI